MKTKSPVPYRKVMLAAVLTAALGGCLFGEEEHQPVVSAPEVPVIFNSSNRVTFNQGFRRELTSLRAKDRQAYRNAALGAAQILAFSDLDVDASIFDEGIPDIRPFDEIDLRSEDDIRTLGTLLADRFSGGVTFESIASMGKKHQDNAVVIYQNAAILAQQQLRERRSRIREKMEQFEALLSLFVMVQPRLNIDADGSATLTTTLLNDTGLPVSAASATFSTTTADGKVIQGSGEIKFPEPVAPTGKMLKISNATVSHEEPFPAGGYQVSARIDQLQSSDFSVDTGDLSEAGQLVEMMHQSVDRFVSTIEHTLTQASRDFIASH